MITPEIYYITFVVFTLVIFYFIYQFLKFKKSQLLESDVTILFYTIDSATNMYKELFFNDNLKELYKKYDLEQNSRTNSSHQFNVEYNELVKNSAKEIINMYISNNIKKTAFKYFTFNSLVSYIINSLRS